VIGRSSFPATSSDYADQLWWMLRLSVYEAYMQAKDLRGGNPTSGVIEVTVTFTPDE
jgi:hypothetical protein